MAEIICRCTHDPDQHKRVEKKDPVSIQPCSHEGCDCEDLRYALVPQTEGARGDE